MEELRGMGQDWDGRSRVGAERRSNGMGWGELYGVWQRGDNGAEVGRAGGVGERGRNPEAIGQRGLGLACGKAEGLGMWGEQWGWEDGGQ